jgi:hypothetical protein
MALEDYAEPEVLIAVAVTAAVASPPVRRVLRRGLVYGLAGLLTVGDKLGSAARGLATRAQHLAAHREQTAEGTEGPSARRSMAAAAG